MEKIWEKLQETGAYKDILRDPKTGEQWPEELRHLNLSQFMGIVGFDLGVSIQELKEVFGTEIHLPKDEVEIKLLRKRYLELGIGDKREKARQDLARVRNCLPIKNIND